MDKIDGWELGNFRQRSMLGSSELIENKVDRIKHKKVLVQGGHELTIFESKPTQPSRASV